MVVNEKRKSISTIILAKGSSGGERDVGMAQFMPRSCTHVMVINLLKIAFKFGDWRPQVGQGMILNAGIQGVGVMYTSGWLGGTGVVELRSRSMILEQSR